MSLPHARLTAVFIATAGLLAEARSGPPSPIRHEGAVTAIAFAPDGTLLASGGEDQVVGVLDVASGRERHQLHGHRGRIAALAFAPDGKVLASGGRDGTVYLWGPHQGKLLRRCEGHERTVLAVAFAPDGRHLASGSYDGTVRLWETATGREAAKIDAHADAVSCVCFSPDGRLLASGGYDGLVRLWAVGGGGGAAKRLHALPAGGGGEVTGAAFCAGGRLLATGSAGGRLLRWHVASGAAAGGLRGAGGSVLALASSPDGRALVVGGLGGQVELYEEATGRAVGHWAVYSGDFHTGRFTAGAGYPGEARAVAVSAGGLLVAAGTKEGRVHVWDVGALLCRKRPPLARPGSRDLERLWDELGDADGAAGYRAVAVLAGHPALALPLLRARLRPEPELDRVRLARLLADLESRRFAVREGAATELERMAEAAEPLLREVLAGRPSLEMRRRLERILQPLEERVPSPARLRGLRALLAAERMATSEARAFVESLAGGSAGAWLTREAKQALGRFPPR